MFARWQAQLAPFDFTIEYKKGKDNILPDFLTCKSTRMIPQRRRGGYSQRGRGRGQNNILVKHGRQRLIASNIAESSASSAIPKPNDPLYGEFMEFLKNKIGNNPSYASALNEEENEDLQEYHQSSYKEKIIFLEYQDVMRYFDSGNDPWILMSRYLDNAPYATHA
nr:hypothetical protein [Tanacetum cinerariifolium]